MDILSKVSLWISIASTHTDTFTLKLTDQFYLIFFFFYPYGLKTNLPCRHFHPVALILYIAHLLSPLLWTVTSCSHSLMWSHVHHLQHSMMSHTSSDEYKKKKKQHHLRLTKSQGFYFIWFFYFGSVMLTTFYFHCIEYTHINYIYICPRRKKQKPETETL